jgi:hypothetical protein
MRVAKWMIAAGLMIGAQTLNAGQVFFEDFETGSGGLTGGDGVVGTQGFSGVPGFLTQFYRNSTLNPIVPTTLTLNGLPSHNFLNVSFLLAIIDQWDGDALGDQFNMTVDGTPVLGQTYTNYDLGQPYAGTRLSTSGCDCGFGSQGDNAYALTLSVPHTSSTATIEFFASGPNWASDDNSWAIDNLSVSADVPEPGVWVLMASGLLALVLGRRRAGSALGA